MRGAAVERLDRNGARCDDARTAASPVEAPVPRAPFAVTVPDAPAYWSLGELLLENWP